MPKLGWPVPVPRAGRRRPVRKWGRPMGHLIIAIASMLESGFNLSWQFNWFCLVRCFIGLRVFLYYFFNVLIKFKLTQTP